MSKAARAGFASRLHVLLASAPARRLLCREDGAGAVEFALVAAPCLALIFAIIETALVFFAGQYLETVVADSSRLIMTGQVQTQGLGQSQFLNQVCGKIVALFNCSSLIVDVQKYTAYSGANTSMPLSNGRLTFATNAQGQPITNFQPGGPGDIVVERIMYEWPVMLCPPPPPSLSHITHKNQLLIATAP